VCDQPRLRLRRLCGWIGATTVRRWGGSDARSVVEPSAELGDKGASAIYRRWSGVVVGLTVDGRTMVR
jgi:hypothetical protein